MNATRNINYSTGINNLDDRTSFYDNVPNFSISDTNVAKARGFSEIEDLAQDDAVFEDTLVKGQDQLRGPTESEDDLFSISSQDEEDGDNNPGVDLSRATKSKVMGSVDSGVPSSPVLRSPRYALLYADFI